MLLRLSKVPRLLRIRRLLRSFKMVSQSPVFKIFYVVLGCFMFTHWAGCGFFFFARWEVRPLGLGFSGAPSAVPFLASARQRINFCI